VDFKLLPLVDLVAIEYVASVQDGRHALCAHLGIEGCKLVFGLVQIAELRVANDAELNRVVVVWQLQHDLAPCARRVFKRLLKLVDLAAAVRCLELLQRVPLAHVCSPVVTL